MADLDDATLVHAAQSGDRDALETLLRRHHDRIYALCWRMTGNDPDALDATQEALITIVRGLHRFDGRAAFTTWSYRVATNACLDELRRRRRRPDPVEPETEFMETAGPPMFDETLVTKLSIDEALLDLPDSYRAAVVLRDQLGLEYSEIADVLGIPIGTVRSRLARGRSALADRLKPAADTNTAPGDVSKPSGTPGPPGTSDKEHHEYP